MASLKINKRKNKSKLCPECGEGDIRYVVYDKEYDGVKYSEYFEECSECSFNKKMKHKKHLEKEV